MDFFTLSALFPNEFATLHGSFVAGLSILAQISPPFHIVTQIADTSNFSPIRE